MADRFDNLELNYDAPEGGQVDTKAITTLIAEHRPQTIIEFEDSISLKDYKRHLQYANNMQLKFIEHIVHREAIARCLHERQNRL